MTDFPGLLQALVGSRVDFIIVGGLAATIHGSSRLTSDIDIVYARSDANLTRLVESLRPFKPYVRGADPGLPFDWSAATLKRGLNFTLTTTLGPIDLLGEIAGGGDHEDIVNQTVDVELFGVSCRCLTLDALISTKRAAGRRKDLDLIAELEALREEAGESSNE